MRVLFVSNYFPPEVNAPATRIHEHARVWVADGGEVEVLTAVPNFPEGRLYEGYENRLTRETWEGVEALRVPVYIAPNEGTFPRTLAYLSFMVSAIRHAREVEMRPDVVVATSPQIFCALAGSWLARRFGVPFVLEVRDLWPESIIEVGALRNRVLIRLFERLERYLYNSADRVVVVTESFIEHVVDRGVDLCDVSVVKNGVEVGRVRRPVVEKEGAKIRREFGWQDAFVATYAGTIGVAHRADVLLEAADLCEDPEVAWVVIGTGSQRADLEERASRAGLENFFLIEKQPKDRVFHYIAGSDIAVVHLRDLPSFRKVLPSKIFEAMALSKPIVLGVEGESRSLVEASDAGIAFPPENPAALVEAVLRLKNDRNEYTRLASNGPRFVAEHFDRRELARRYWRILEGVVKGRVEHRDGQAVLETAESA